MHHPKFKITITNDYLIAIGRAYYNFIYFEKCIYDLIANIDPDNSVLTKDRAGASDFKEAIVGLMPSFDSGQLKLIRKIIRDYNKMSAKRNMLVHAMPYSAPNGAQQITHRLKEWPIEELFRVAKQFEDVAIYTINSIPLFNK